MAP
ncbi:hypothetical protein D020_2192A, partial [Vibrio parahaemolyticus SBR10290]|jgi:hypothetical protein